MRKIVTTLVTASIALVLAGNAQAKAGQYTRFNESTAANGAHLYAREHMDATPRVKVTTDCLTLRWSSSGYSALWLCAVDTWQGNNTHLDHALIGVARVNGHYEFRSYTAVRNDS